MTKPSFQEICVVVQGPIVGTPQDAPSERRTERCIRSLRKHLPGAEVILSTWKGSVTQGLDFDRLVESEDPGGVMTHIFGNPCLNNVNRQVCSSRAGILQARRRFVLKIRSDIELQGAGFLDYFGKFRTRATAWKILSERVVACSVYSRNPRRPQFPGLAFHPSDFIFFGYRDDLLKIFDIPLEPIAHATWMDGKRQLDILPSSSIRYIPEQYIWVSFLRKYGEVPFQHLWDNSQENIALSELTIANNLVVISPKQWELTWLKHPSVPFILQNVYTYREWVALYRRYCKPGLVFVFDGEHFIFYTLRLKAILAHVPHLKGSWSSLSPSSYRVLRPIYRFWRNGVSRVLALVRGKPKPSAKARLHS